MSSLPPDLTLLSGRLDLYFSLIFWACLGAIVYTYIGYPLLLWVLAKFRGHTLARPSTAPKITLLICAHNEAGNIAKKLEDSLTLNYPPDKLEILVVSDGSVDGTNDIVRSFLHRGVGLIGIPRQGGKTHAQNLAVPYSTGEIIVFSDATTLYHPNALQYIAGNFADPSVGAVSGRYCYSDPGKSAATNSGARTFATYDNRIREMQSDIYTLTGCCGCIYAVRRSLYTPLAPHIISDLVEPLRVLMQGSRVKFEPRAVAWESATDTSAKEFSMRVRVIARTLHGLDSVSSLLAPWKHPWIALQLFSHKVLRYSIPVFLLCLLVFSLLLSHIPLYKAFFYAQLFLYGVAFVAALIPTRKLAKPLKLPLYFCIVNAAALGGFLQFIRGKRYTSWKPEREVSHAP